MMNSISKVAVTSKVTSILADILQKQPDMISGNMTLFDDLGLESVEVLELAFELEQEFSLQIEADALWRVSDYILANELFKDGKFSEEANALIKSTLKNLPSNILVEIKNPHDILKYLKVDDMIDYVYKNTSSKE